MKKYLGDGVYVTFDGFSLWLTTENRVEIGNTICLKPEVWASLKAYAEQLALYEPDTKGRTK